MTDERQHPQWTGEVGPRQARAFKKAWGNLGTAHNTYKHKTIPGMRITVFDLTGKMGEAELAAKRKIGDRHGWTVTRATCAAIVAEIEAATTARLAQCPEREEQRA